MPTTMQLIAKQTVGAGGAASVTFSSIPQTFTDLKVLVSSRSSDSNNGQVVNISFNGSTANISARLLTGNGVSAGSSTSTSNAYYTTANAATASTFGNSEIYFPNYTSSNNKSFSSDGVTENNLTQAFTVLLAGLWSQTAAITSLTFTPAGSNFTEFTEITLYGISNSTTTQNPTTPSAIGGDIITTDGSFWYHAFRYSGSFTPLKNLTADVLVVAGGGAGGRRHAGGGGAGGVSFQTARNILAGSYSVVIGAGGAGRSGSEGVGSPGANSTFDTIISNGGAGSLIYGSGAAGGSGGGNNASQAGGAANQGNTGGATGYGNAGGAGFDAGDFNGGGGGGATSVGAAAVNGAGGNGGTGISGLTNSIINAMGSATSTGQLSGGNYYYAGGGGGGVFFNVTVGAGGLGGGTAGTNSGNTSNATANTGGGSGGQGNDTANSGSGGSGIVIVRYAV